MEFSTWGYLDEEFFVFFLRDKFFILSSRSTYVQKEARREFPEKIPVNLDFCYSFHYTYVTSSKQSSNRDELSRNHHESISIFQLFGDEIQGVRD